MSDTACFSRAERLLPDPVERPLALPAGLHRHAAARRHEAGHRARGEVAVKGREVLQRLQVSGDKEVIVSYIVLQKVPSEANSKVRNHGEGPY